MSEIKSFYSRLGDKIRNKREAADWSQKYLASQLNINRVSLSNIESGKQMVPFHQLLQISKLLLFDIQELDMKAPSTGVESELSDDPVIAALIAEFDSEEGN